MTDPKSPIKYAIINAFTDSAGGGNPAVVCLMEEEREETWMQLVAKELGTPVTCFLTRISDLQSDSTSFPKFKLRWFSTITQVTICGHATLAASHYCFTSSLMKGNTIEYSTLAGTLTAKKISELLIELDFPLIPLMDYNLTEISSISEALNGASIVDIKQTTTEHHIIIAVLDSAAAVANLEPNFGRIRNCPGKGIVISSLAPPDSKFDFISRFFFPKLGVNEDSVCGSAHCALAKYWSRKLGKCDFLAYAASTRSGVVKLHLDENNNRVRLQGEAFTVMEGSLLV